MRKYAVTLLWDWDDLSKLGTTGLNTIMVKAGTANAAAIERASFLAPEVVESSAVFRMVVTWQDPDDPEWVEGKFVSVRPISVPAETKWEIV